MPVEWNKSYGGSHHDYGKCIRQTADGGYIMVGHALSVNGNIFGKKEGDNLWIVKLEANGTINWQISLPESDNDYDILQTKDGGYVFVGDSFLNDEILPGETEKRGWDVRILKLDANGNTTWLKHYGGSGIDIGQSIQQTIDGGYIISCHTTSVNCDVQGSHGGTELWILKLDPQGNLDWQKTLGGTSWDTSKCIRQTADGGYVVGGISKSANGDVSENKGNYDFWIVKLTDEGNISWERSFGGSEWDELKSIIQTSDGEYIAVGLTHSSDGDIVGHHGSSDYLVVKLDGDGNVLWHKALGGTRYEAAHDIFQTGEKEIVVVGEASSSDGDVSKLGNEKDFWFVKLDNAGNLLDQTYYAGKGFSKIGSIDRTNDGGYIVATSLFDENMPDNHGWSDVWIVKMNGDFTTEVIDQKKKSIRLYPNPTNDFVHLDYSGRDLKRISMFDITGKTVESHFNNSNRTFDLSRLPDGIYVIQFTIKDQVYTRRILKY